MALTCKNTGAEETHVDVPVLYYMGYVARDSRTEEQLTVRPADNQRVCVILPAGYEGSFVVKYEAPWYWRICELICVAAFGGLICAFALSYRRQHGFIV